MIWTNSKSCFLLLALCVSAFADDQEAVSIFPGSSELIYKFRGDVSTGSTTPANYVSHFALLATIRIITDKTANKALFKFENVEFSAYNGKATNGKLPLGEYSTIPVSPDANCSCAIPFAATYHSGKVTNINFKIEDPLWSRNIKRAVVSQLQLDLPFNSNKHVFTSTETGISGSCKVDNTIVDGDGPDKLLLWKLIDISQCDEPSLQFDNLSPIMCPSSASKSPVSSSAERKYELKKGSEMLIEKLVSRAGIAVQPHSFKGEFFYQVTNQSMSLVSMTAITTVSELEGKTITTSLAFEFPKLDPNSGADPDMYFERQSPNMTYLINFILSELSLTTEKLSGKYAAESLDPTKLHEVDLYRLFILARKLDLESLRQVADTVFLGTSNKDESIRNLFVEILPQIGTRAGVLLSIELCAEGKINEKDAAKVVSVLPFFLRLPDVKLLIDAKNMLNLGDKVTPSVQKSSTLAFASIIGKVCETGACQPALLDEYVKYFFELLRDSTDYGDQLFYLQSMNNIQVGPVAEYLEPLIVGQLNYTHYLRFRAVWATKNVLLRQPEKAYEIYWPMLLDRREHLEMRCAALTMLLVSQPTKSIFIKLLWVMSAERNIHLYHLFYTTVQSLVNVKNPCYSHMSASAAQLVHLLRLEPQNRPYVTGNYIFDYKVPDLEVGSQVHMYMIADEVTGYPNTAYVEMSSYAAGVVGNSVAFAFRLEGDQTPDKIIVGEWMKKTSELNAHLKQILASMKVTPRDPVPLKMELIIFVQGRAIATYHVGLIDENFDSKLEDLKKTVLSLVPTLGLPGESKSHGVPLNHQYLTLMTSLESVQPSDMGVPLILDLNTPYLFSVKGNLAFSVKTPLVMIENVVDARAILQHSYGLRTFNPMAKLWHEVYKSYSYNIDLPIKSSLQLDIAQYSIKHRFDWESGKPLFSLTQHTKTNTFALGGQPGFLSKCCPSCEISSLVTAGDNYRKSSSLMRTKMLDSELEFNLSLFECEGTHILEDQMNLWAGVFSKRNNNNRVLPKFGSLILGALQLDSQLGLAPLVGTCGVQMQVLPVGKSTSTELVLKAEISKNDRLLIRALRNFRNTEDEIIKSWDANLIYDSPEEDNELGVKLRLTRKVKDEPSFMVCMKVDSIYPKNKGFWWDLLYEPSLSTLHTQFSVALEFGETTDGKCPQGGSSLSISGVSAMQDKNINEWPVSKCEQDKGNNKYYPVTPACIKSAEEASLARNISVSVKHSNMPESVKSVLSRTHAILYFINPEDIPAEFSQNFTIDLLTSRSGEIFFKLSRDGKFKEMEKSVKLPSLTKVMSEVSHPLSIRAALLSSSLIGKCMVAGGKVSTFDNATIDFSATSGYTLLTADCDSIPKVAIFARKIQGSDTLGLRIYSLDDIIEITPGSTGTTVTLNGEPFNQNATETIKVEITPDHIIVKETVVHTEVIHSDSNIHIIVYNSNRGRHCGLCGDNNGYPENELNFPGPDANPMPLSDLVKAYTLPPSAA